VNRQKGTLMLDQSKIHTELLTRLREQILARYSDDELRTLCADLGIDYHDLPAESRAGRARELVSMLDRQGRISELQNILARSHSTAPKPPKVSDKGMKSTRISWRLPLQVIAILTILVSLAWFFFSPGFELLLALLTGIATLIATFIGGPQGTSETLYPPSIEGSRLYSATCGNKGLDLAQQRLAISTAFGTYFAGLLERDNNYVLLKGQIDAPVSTGPDGWDPIECILWGLERAAGPTILIIAAEGGMGKSTLAAKIVRCLFEQQAVDMILGDSAKIQRMDPITGDMLEINPAYYDLDSFCERLCRQLGLPFKRGRGGANRALTDIRDRLEGRRAVIVADNLETVARGDELFHSLKKIATRDVRVIVTTRMTKGIDNSSSTSMVVHLKPIKDLSDAREFLNWHIRHHQMIYPELCAIKPELDNEKHVQQLVSRTGGIPLLMQLVISDVARVSSWDYLEKLPNLFGDELLNFLYEARWDELGNLGEKGVTARQLLHVVANEQYKGRKVSLDRLVQWATDNNQTNVLPDALRLLYERFLIINHDPSHGNFAIFPSLSEFLQRQQ